MSKYFILQYSKKESVAIHLYLISYILSDYNNQSHCTILDKKSDISTTELNLFPVQRNNKH